MGTGGNQGVAAGNQGAAAPLPGHGGGGGGGGPVVGPVAPLGGGGGVGGGGGAVAPPAGAVPAAAPAPAGAVGAAGAAELQRMRNRVEELEGLVREVGRNRARPRVPAPATNQAASRISAYTGFTDGNQVTMAFAFTMICTFTIINFILILIVRSFRNK